MTPLTTLCRWSAVLLALACSLPTRAQSLSLIADLNPTPLPASSSPTFGAELPNGTCVFAARTLTNGLEPWIMGPGGPSLLKDIASGRDGSAPRSFVRSGNFVYFTANDMAHGSELWKTDGTEAGTVMVSDLFAGPSGSLPEELIDVNGTVFFAAYEPATGRELYKSDGSASGTGLVRDVLAGPLGSTISNLVACNGRAFFVADDLISGDELWVSDGTAAGTVRLSDFRAGDADGVSRVVRPACSQGRVFFGARGNATGDELGVSDGTVAGTILININPGGGSSSPSDFTSCGTTMFFAAARTGVGRELFKSDGTAAGTVLVKDFNPGSASSFLGPMACCNGMLFVAAQENTFGKELYKSDGTTAGTVLVKDILPGFLGSGPTFMACCNGRLFFSAQAPGLGRELWCSDGTEAGTFNVVDTAPGSLSSDPDNLFCCHGTLLYASTGTNGKELFSTDGTALGTIDHDLDPTIATAGSNPKEYTVAGPNQFFFRADVAGMGTELCYFDGTQVIVHDIEPGPNGSFPSQLTFVGDTLYFEARTAATGRELYKATRDTPPALVRDLTPGSGSSTPTEIVPFGVDRVIFSADVPLMGREVGVAGAGIQDIRMLDIRANGSSNPTGFTIAIDDSTGQPVAFFAANDGVNGVELHATNGTTSVLVADINPGSANGNPKIVAHETNFFATDLLFASELSFAAQTAAGAVIEQLDIIDPFGLIFNRQQVLSVVGFEFLNIQIASDTLQFLGAITELSSSGMGTEFFTFDPANGLTIFDLLPGIFRSSFPELFARNGDVTTFVAEGEGMGREIYRYDAASRTLTSSDVLPGPESSNPQSLQTSAHDAYFLANGSSDPRDVDVFLEFFGGAPGKIVDFDPQADDNFFLDQSLTRFFGDFLATGSTGASGKEAFLIEDAAAMSQPFGQRSAGATLTVDDPALGSTIDIKVNFQGAALVSGLLVIAPAPSAAPIVLPDGAEFWADPASLVILAENLGASTQITVPIPNDPALAGICGLLQAIFVPVVPQAIKTTNAVQYELR